MAEKNGSTNDADSSAESTTDTQLPAPVQSTRSSRSPLAAVALLVALGAAGGAGYLWQLNQQQTAAFEQLQQQFSQVAQQARLQKQNVVELTTWQQRVDSQAQNAEQQRNAIQQQLFTHQQQLQSLATTDRTNWLLAEAEYLIRLATQRLLMSHETDTAAQLLQAADELVVGLDDSALLPVRRALASDIATLKGTEKVDVEGLYLQLEALAQQVAKLQLFVPPQLGVKTVESAAEQAERDWKAKLEQSLTSVWQRLGQYVQIRRRDEAFQPSLAPEHEALLRQNLQLMFEQAQMALMAGNQPLYQRSLVKASQWLERYFTLDAQATQALVEQLSELQTTTIAPEMPDISNSLRALKNYRQQRSAPIVAEGDQA